MASIGQTPTPSSSGSRSSLSISSPFFTHNSSNNSISATPSTSKFKTFRSLLPFGVASASKPSAVGRDRKGSLGQASGGRKDVDRKASLQLPFGSQAFLPPVIAIESGRGDFEEEVRRGLENAPQAQSSPGRPHTFREPLPTAFTRSKPLPAEPSPPNPPSRLPSPRIPSPLASPLNLPSLPLPPSPSADLSTIVEADTSGISLSRHLPDESCDLSTSQLDEQVRDAMTATSGWDGFQVDVEEPSFSVEMDTVHPDIAALLSPNNISKTLVTKKQSSLPRLRPKSTGSSPGSGSTGRVSPAGRISPAPPSPLRASHTRSPPSRTSTSPPVFTPPPRSLPPRAASATRPSMDTRRTRKRSMSTSTPSRPSTSMSVEWLGPRTAKAFRAAGLLDESAPPAHQPRRGSVDSRYTAQSATLSRFGSLRSDRSASRMSSESPRSASTAPTSLSWGDRDKDEDTTRHAMEMSALLGALSDSQRTARVLREENAELRERLESREEELLEIIRQLEDAQRYGEDERVGELEEENAVLRSVVDDLRREIGDMLRKKRYSAVSSVFPAPPANMAMLVGDDPDVGWMQDARPPSADLSILTMSDGSQISLALKPEHAMHLGDMDAMSLYDVSADR